MTTKKLESPLNICLVSQRFPVSGSLGGPAHLRPIASGLAMRGHRVSVLTGQDPFGRRTMQLDGATVHFLMESRGLRTQPDYFMNLVKAKFLDLHSTRPFHIVHSFDDSALKISKYRKNHRVAIVYDATATSIGEIFSILGFEQETIASSIKTLASLTYNFLRTYFGHDRELLKTTDGILVANPRERMTLERYYSFPDAKMYTVPFGFDHFEVKPLSDQEKQERLTEMRLRLGIPTDCRIAIAYSDMREVGEVLSLLLGFERVAVKTHNVRLIIMGDGPKRKNIEYEALMLALGSRVHFVGEVKSSELPLYISLCEVFINVSARSSGLDPSFVEAMAQKKVVIASELGHFSSILDDGVNGFLVRPADTEEIRSLLEEILSDSAPQKIVSEIGEAAHKKVADLYDPTKMLDATVLAYQMILASTKNRRYHEFEQAEQNRKPPIQADITSGAP